MFQIASHNVILRRRGIRICAQFQTSNLDPHGNRHNVGIRCINHQTSQFRTFREYDRLKFSDITTRFLNPVRYGGIRFPTVRQLSSKENPKDLGIITGGFVPALRQRVTHFNSGDLVSVYGIIVLILLIVFSPFVAR
jgi:hypothetical protein